MRKMKKYNTVFVEQIPEKLDNNKLYVCIKYNIAAHRCACGCGTEIFTPISKKFGWTLSYDGENASLKPSIGNGNYSCHSHYFLKDGTVQWLTPIKSDSVPIEKMGIKTLKRILMAWKKDYYRVCNAHSIVGRRNDGDSK